jgi:ribosomal protein S18 acetylase RimI-like enzyme
MSQNMTHSRRASEPTDFASMPVHVREARAEDLPALAPLLVRLKRLNEEFDPLLKVRSDVEAQAKSILDADLRNANSVVLVAEGVGPEKEKVVGIVRALLRERPFYTPETEGVIVDIYLLPFYRRRGVGEYLLNEIAARLKAKGAGIVTADFPSQNEIAARFYAKRGFRPITTLHARSV